MTVKTTLLFLATICIFAACKTTANNSDEAASQKTTSTQINTNEALVQLSKTSCKGTCPAFTLMVFEDGSLAYDGKVFVDHIGAHQANTKAANLKTLKGQLKSSKFIGLQDDYLAKVMDLPSVKLVYQGKTIRFHKHEAPESLNQIVATLDQLIADTNWKKAE